jgi:hypothetical protein
MNSLILCLTEELVEAKIIGHLWMGKALESDTTVNRPVFVTQLTFADASRNCVLPLPTPFF